MFSELPKDDVARADEHRLVRGSFSAVLTIGLIVAGSAGTLLAAMFWSARTAVLSPLSVLLIGAGVLLLAAAACWPPVFRNDFRTRTLRWLLGDRYSRWAWAAVGAALIMLGLYAAFRLPTAA